MLVSRRSSAAATMLQGHNNTLCITAAGHMQGQAALLKRVLLFQSGLCIMQQSPLCVHRLKKKTKFMQSWQPQQLAVLLAFSGCCSSSHNICSYPYSPTTAIHQPPQPAAANNHNKLWPILCPNRQPVGTAPPHPLVHLPEGPAAAAMAPLAQQPVQL